MYICCSSLYKPFSLVPNGRVAVLTMGCHLPLYLVDIKPRVPGSTVVKNPPAKGQDSRHTGSIPGSGRSPGEGNGYPLQYSCLGNPMDREAWQATVHGITKSWTQLSTDIHTHTHPHTHIRPSKVRRGKSFHST